jgi:hypothetical protein
LVEAGDDLLVGGVAYLRAVERGLKAVTVLVDAWGIGFDDVSKLAI